MTNEQLTIKVTQIESNELYRRQIRRVKEPIFLTGDNVCCKLQIQLPTEETIRHKGISSGLLTILVQDKQKVTILSEERKVIMSKGIIAGKMEFDVVFQNIQANQESFFGRRYQIYHVVDFIITRYFKQDLKATLPLIVLQPQKELPDSRPIKKTLRFNGLSINIATDKSIYSTTDNIEGEVSFFGEFDSDLVSLDLKIIREESIPNESPDRVKRWTAVDHQIAEGSPRPGSRIPFRVGLQTLKLWTSTNSGIRDVHVAYLAEFSAKGRSGGLVSVSYPIIIVRVSLD